MNSNKLQKKETYFLTFRDALAKHKLEAVATFLPVKL